MGAKINLYAMDTRTAANDQAIVSGFREVDDQVFGGQQNLDFLGGRGFGQGAATALDQAKAIDPDTPGVVERLPSIAALLHLDAVSESPLFEMFTRDEDLDAILSVR